MYIKSEDNVADIASKVTDNPVFERLSYRIKEGMLSVMEDHVNSMKEKKVGTKEVMALVDSEWKGVERGQKN